MHRASNPARWQVLAEIQGWLAHEHHTRSLGPLGFENTYALAVRRETAERLGLHTLADLASSATQLALGADYEFLGRAEWAAVQRTYGVRFASATTFDPALLYDAIARHEIDAISAFSSDGRIAGNDLVVLADPAGALPPYDATILLGRARRRRSAHRVRARVAARPGRGDAPGERHGRSRQGSGARGSGVVTRARRRAGVLRRDRSSTRGRCARVASRPTKVCYCAALPRSRRARAW